MGWRAAYYDHGGDMQYIPSRSRPPNKLKRSLHSLDPLFERFGDEGKSKGKGEGERHRGQSNVCSTNIRIVLQPPGQKTRSPGLK